MYSGTVGAVPHTAISARIPQVQDAIESLQNLSIGLHDEIERVERKLECVARPAAPAGPVESPAGHEVPVVGRLSLICQSMRSAREKLADLYDRLEV